LSVSDIHLISDFDTRADSMGAERDLFSGLIVLHILHHAAKGPVFGLWIIEELRRHGYHLGPGTLYPMLHRLERQGYLASANEVVNRRQRRIYRLTPPGLTALAEARHKVRELHDEMFEDEGN
jgi:PadR family transcriptional regulator, regulatory protein PadR